MPNTEGKRVADLRIGEVMVCILYYLYWATFVWDLRQWRTWYTLALFYNTFII